MGYYTTYTLTVHDATPEESAELNERIIDSGMEFWDKDSYTSYDTWYEHDEELLALSKEYPTILFELYGEGEQNDDMWYTYYKNGRLQHCPAQITFDPFNEAKLILPADEIVS